MGRNSISTLSTAPCATAYNSNFTVQQPQPSGSGGQNVRMTNGRVIITPTVSVINENEKSGLHNQVQQPIQQQQSQIINGNGSGGGGGNGQVNQGFIGSQRNLTTQPNATRPVNLAP